MESHCQGRRWDNGNDTMGKGYAVRHVEMKAELLHKTIPKGNYEIHCFGKLDYRTLRFEEERIGNCANYQGIAAINYTDSEVPYTRIIEHKHFEYGGQSHTVITREYSSEWEEGSEPYYPVNDAKNEALYKQYELLAKQEPNVIFGGRLGQYKYFDMHHIIEQVLQLSEVM